LVRPETFGPYYVSLRAEPFKIIRPPTNLVKTYKCEKTKPVTVYYMHEAKCLFTNAKNVSEENLQMPQAALILL
jgi:hypothetical protein